MLLPHFSELSRCTVQILRLLDTRVDEICLFFVRLFEAVRRERAFQIYWLTHQLDQLRLLFRSQLCDDNAILALSNLLNAATILGKYRAKICARSGRLNSPTYLI